MAIYDATVPTRSGMPIYEGDPPVRIAIGPVNLDFPDGTTYAGCGAVNDDGSAGSLRVRLE